MFQVLAVGLGSEFAPLKTLDATPGNLRPQTTSFIGREAELAEVQEAVKAHRLVTLTGVGGVGKTRLATEVAARLADEFADGVWLFEFADPAAVPDAVAAVLGITPAAWKNGERRPRRPQQSGQQDAAEASRAVMTASVHENPVLRRASIRVPLRAVVADCRRLCRAPRHHG